MIPKLNSSVITKKSADAQRKQAFFFLNSSVLFNSDKLYTSKKFFKSALQKKLFDELGKGVLENAWKGYNCSLFAYGQTGSGKSYSMVGYDSNKGTMINCNPYNEFQNSVNHKALAGRVIGALEWNDMHSKYITLLNLSFTGIIPATCEELFKQIEEKKADQSDIEYQVKKEKLHSFQL